VRQHPIMLTAPFYQSPIANESLKSIENHANARRIRFADFNAARIHKS